MPLDHLTLRIPVSKVDAFTTFLTASFPSINFKQQFRSETMIGFGDGKPWFWISTGGAGVQIPEDSVKGLHIAFVANSAEEVKSFHASALEAGGLDNGKPGLRTHIHEGYFAAFVIDPVCGVNFEVVFRGGKGEEV